MGKPFAIEVLRDSLTEEDNVRHDAGLESVDKRYQLMREPQYKETRLALDDPRVIQLVTETDYDALRVSEKYRHPKTAQEIEEERVSEVNYLNSLIDNAVKKVRLAAASDLPFQSDAYHLKEEQAKAWDGTGEAPQMIQAAADRFGITSMQAKTLLLEKGIAWRELLDESETLRERGYALAQQNDVEGVKTVVAKIEGLGSA